MQYLLRKKWLLTLIILVICVMLALLVTLLLIHPQMGKYTDASYI